MKVFLIALLVFLSQQAKTQTTISGFVQDKKTSERLVGVNVYEPLSEKGTTSNSFGYFSISLPGKKDSLELVFSFTGYISKRIYATSKSQNMLTVELEPGITLDEVVITAGSQEKLQIGKSILPLNQIENFHSFLGESDILRSFQLMPGIHSGKEGTAGMFVRGGSPDQNLILLDDLPLYYVNHIGGFISVFNTEALKSAELYRGGFPARYGGRTSSVTDIRSKEGNMRELKGIVSAGIVSSKLLFEGPLKKEKSSFLISARRSFLDIFTRVWYKLHNTENFTAGYNLYDLNGKVNYIISETDRIYLSLYSGRDKIFAKQIDLNTLSDDNYSFSSIYGRSWGNHSASLRWNHIFSTKLFTNITFGRTNFFYKNQQTVLRKEKQSGNVKGKAENTLFSGITDFILKADAELFLEKHHLKFGAASTFHRFLPTSTEFIKQADYETDNPEIYRQKNELVAFSTSIYISDELKLSKKIIINAGLHASIFSVESKNYFSPEPRITALWEVNHHFFLKASYDKMMQAVHLLSSNDNGIPTDLWVPSTKQVAPQKSDIVAFGISGEICKGMFSYDIEAYYKQLTDLIDLKEGDTFFAHASNWQNNIEKEGSGKSWGLEIFLKKNQGKFKGFISYTFSRAERTFRNINFGRPYPFNYDKPHDLSVFFSSEINESTEFSATWVISTGLPTTLPFGRYFIYGFDPDNDQVSESGPGFGNVHLYGERNNFRLPAYHRLDLNINFKKELKSGSRVWSLGLYNAYNHHNTYTIFFEQKKNEQVKLYSVSLFPVIPSISYTYRF